MRRHFALYGLLIVCSLALSTACHSRSEQKEQEAALDFLYRYMPLNDRAELPRTYFEQAVSQAFHARQTLPWGSSVPDALFLQYVVPPRVNNESLDNARDVFYRELYPRVKDLDMYHAVLEVNHWCREKVLYQPTDIRTSPPLATVRRGYGRCGEESVVAVVALRSVGIPARQVYVPRWSHTDDNHAWVEVWVDGTWYYLGACEPEPELNRGWFTASASRAMLVNTWATGTVTDTTQGEVISQNACYTEISHIANYAPVKKAVVQVVDRQGAPVTEAQVSFGVYNYAEFYPLARRQTDAQGLAELTTGLGSLFIEVYQAATGRYTQAPFSVRDTDTLRLCIEDTPEAASICDFRLTPPAQTKNALPLDPAVAEAHALRCQADDSLRLAHIATFPFNDLEKAQATAATYTQKGLPQDLEATLSRLLHESLVNGPQLIAFLDNTPADHLALAVRLLEQLRIKDVQEISAAVLSDYLQGVLHLENAYQDTPLMRENVLNPRIYNEAPLAYKEALWERLVQLGMRTPGPLPENVALIRAELDSLALQPELNPRDFHTAPLATAMYRVACPISRAIYGVALLRTAGIPARIDPVSKQFQAYLEGEWVSMDAASAGQPAAQGVLTLTYPLAKGQHVPAYDTQFTLQQWSPEEGAFRTLGFSTESGGVAGTTVLNTPHTLAAGTYRVVSGIRLADGGVWVRLQPFTLQADTHKEVVLSFAPANDELTVVGHVNVEASFTMAAAETPGEETTILKTVGRNFFILALLDATQEPSQHFIREFAALQPPLSIPTLFLFPSDAAYTLYRSQAYPVGDGVHYGIDTQLRLCQGLEQSLELEHLSTQLPVVLLADSFGNVFYYTTGYRLGVADRLQQLKIPQ